MDNIPPSNNKANSANERNYNSETAATPKKLQSEVTSTTHKDNHDDQDIDGSVKSIEHLPHQINTTSNNKPEAEPKKTTLSSLIMPMSYD